MAQRQDRSIVAAGFYRVGQDGDGGNLFVRFPKAAEEIEALRPGEEAHVRVYDDGSAEIDVGGRRGE